jgi:hypothetical protein
VEDEEELEIGKEDRDKSREMLLKHLNENCQKDPYRPEKLAQLSEAIVNDYFEYLKKKEELKKELELEKQKFQETKSISSKSSNISSENNKFESEEKQKESESNAEIINTKELIAELQDKKERLQKEIAEKEKIIHQKVLKHIFNNYEAINKELGGDIFLNSVAGDHP